MNSVARTSLSIPLDWRMVPQDDDLEETTSAENPRKRFPAGSLILTYMEMIVDIWKRDQPFSPAPWIRGCRGDWRCSYLHFGDRPQPALGTIAWALITCMSAEFELNIGPRSANWIVEHWTYNIDDTIVTDISNNFEEEVRSIDTTGRNGTATGICSSLTKRDLPSQNVRWQETNVRIPLKHILYLFTDLFVNFFLPLSSNEPISPKYPRGYKFSARTADFDAVMTLEFLNTEVRQPYASTPITARHLFLAIYCRIFSAYYTGDYQDEEQRQWGFKAGFAFPRATRGQYATLTLHKPRPEEVAGLNGERLAWENLWKGKNATGNMAPVEVA